MSQPHHDARCVAEFEISGFQPSPWSVPEICVTRSGRRFTKRRGRSNLAEGKTNLKDWQKLVADAAREAMGGGRLCLGPVHLEMTFFIRAPEDQSPGAFCFLPLTYNGKSLEYTKKNLKGSTLPDLTNLEKGTEDALELIAMANDFQVVSKSTARKWGHHGGCKVRVLLLEETYEEPQDGDRDDRIQPADEGPVRPKKTHAKKRRSDDADEGRTARKRRPSHH